MKLTVEEFNTLRPIQWTSRVSLDNRIYYTAVNATYTRLFNLDLLRKIIAPKFASQMAIVRLNNYNIDRPIMLRPDLELELPDDVETAMYFAKAVENRDDLTKNYNSKVTMQTVNIVAAVLFAIIALISILVRATPSAFKIINSTGTVNGWRLWLSTLVRDRVL